MEKVDFASFGQAVNALKQGLVDLAVVSASTTALYELESTPKGLHWPEFPASNEEGWKRMRKIIPYVEPFKETIGAGMSKDNPKELVGYRFPIITVRSDAPADKIYAITKAIDESFDLFKDATPVMPLWHVNLTGHGPTEAPYHEGAIRYLKEKGVWNQKDETWNKAYLERMKKLQSAWEQTVEESRSKNMKAKDFPSFWLEKRKELFKND